MKFPKAKECEVKCQGYVSDFCCGEFCERLAIQRAKVDGRVCDAEMPALGNVVTPVQEHAPSMSSHHGGEPWCEVKGRLDKYCAIDECERKEQGGVRCNVHPRFDYKHVANQLIPEAKGVTMTDLEVTKLRGDRDKLAKALKFLLAVSWGSNSDKKGAEKNAENALASLSEKRS